MGELEIKEILNMKLINKETGEVVMTCPVAKVGVNRNLTVIEEDNLKTINWLLEPLDVGDVKVRDEDDEVWKDKVVKW